MRGKCSLSVLEDASAVPDTLFEETKAHLTEFRGLLMRYDSTTKKIRNAIIEVLLDRYPNTWHVCNEKGELIGGQKIYTTCGYNAKTCLKTTEGQVHILLHHSGRESGELASPAMKEYHQADGWERKVFLNYNTLTWAITLSLQVIT